MNATETILLIDDDEKLNHLVVKYLSQNDYEVEIETNGAKGAMRIIEQQPLLVILDIMLPELDGLTICRNVRPHYNGPILMLTALGEDIDEVAGLETGADDYLAKPVRPRVLLARIRALLRRPALSLPSQTSHLPPSTTIPIEPPRKKYNYGDLHIDYRKRSVYLRDITIQLTTAEFELLWLLASHAGRILNRNFIQHKLRGLNYDGIDRSIDLRISRIRKKLGDNSRAPQWIKSVRGVGYIFIQ